MYDPHHPDNWKPKGVREKVRPLIGSGMTCRHMADMIGCSHVAVHRAIRRIQEEGKRPRRVPIRERLPDFFGKGMTQVEVAAELGCDPTTVSKALTRMGCDMNGHPR